MVYYSKEEYKDIFNINEVIVYTSGLGGLFKAGIPVGKIYKDNIDKINFFSDFRQLEYVKISSYDFEGNN